MTSKLREVRKQKLMTQEELSAASGVSRTTICAIEANKQENISAKTMKALAKALGESPALLFF